MTRGAHGAAAAGAPRAVRTSRVVGVDVLFSPYVVALAIYVPLLALFLATPAHVFEETFSTTKHSSPEGIAFYGLAIAAFLLGALIGDVLARRPAAAPRTLPVSLAARLRSVLAAALVVAIGAYALWFALALYRAGGLVAFVDAVRTDPELVRRTLFAPVPGATTFTQLAGAAIPLAIAYRLLDRRLLAPLAGIALLLALSVAVLASLRLTFLELAIPVGYLALAHRRGSLGRVAAVGLGLVAAVAAFFVAAELRRRVPYESYSVADAVVRYLSYYLNTVNNAFAVVENHTFAIPLYFSTQPFWEFPGVGNVIRYEDVFAADAALFHDHFHRYNGLTPGVNTFGVPGATHLELGWGALWVILGIGGVAGALYRAARRDPFFRALYAVWLVGMFEFMRVYYFLLPKLVPTYALFALVFVAVLRPASRSRVRPAEEAP